MNVKLGPVEVAEREWFHQLLGSALGALWAAGIWWLWVWGFKVGDVPSWSFWLAAFVGCSHPIPKFYIRKRR